MESDNAKRGDNCINNSLGEGVSLDHNSAYRAIANALQAIYFELRRFNDTQEGKVTMKSHTGGATGDY